MKSSTALRIACAVSSIFVAAIASAAPAVIDFNPNNNRRDGLSRFATNVTVDADAASVDVASLGVRVTPLAEGAKIKPLAWKGGYDTGGQLVTDGIAAAGGLSVSVSFADAGRHSVALYHNGVDAAPLGAFDVFLDGAKVASNVTPSLRAAPDAKAVTTYIPIDAKAGQTYRIDVKPTDSAGVVIINGLEIDKPDPARRAVLPTPAHGSEHFYQPQLSWTAPDSAKEFEVFLGESESDLKSIGKTATPSFARPAGLRSHKTYFWRVDTTHADGSVTPGEVWRFMPAQLAFPGAEGYGRFARGGRGGRVIQVTNLNDSGPGSFREAVEAEGPRTIVFRVGGTIHLKDRIVVRNPFVTIAGQTAPGEGIALRGAAFGIGGANDVIIRYMRLRVGDESGKTWDGMGFGSADNAIIDHCSIAWSIDEGVSGRGARNITFQRNIIAEPLNMSVHDHYKGTGKGHSFAGSISGDIGSFHSNLLANAAGRNWSLAGGLTQGGKFAGRLDIRNNVVFNFAHRTNDGGVRMANIVDNYYIPGPATKVFHVLLAKMELRLPDDVQQYYVAGNVMEGKYDGKDNWNEGGVTIDPADIAAMKLTAPFCESFITPRTAKEAYDTVIRDVGANIPAPDAIDRRTIDNVIHRTTTFSGSKTGIPGIIDSQTDVGPYADLKGGDPYPDADADGMDDRWEQARGLNPNNPDDRNTVNADGFTNLEHYLNWIVENGRVEPRE
jgi:hypothetical protein